MHAQMSHNKVDENFVDVKFDEEPLSGDEWLHMMQLKEHIDMLFFGERSPRVSGNQGEDNLFTTIKFCKGVEDKAQKEEQEEEMEALSEEHNEDIFNIDFEYAGKEDNNPFKREYEQQVAGKDMDVVKTKMKTLNSFFSSGVKNI